MDDKNLVIITAGIISVVSFWFPESAGLAEKALVGLFGIAVGRSTK